MTTLSNWRDTLSNWLTLRRLLRERSKYVRVRGQWWRRLLKSPWVAYLVIVLVGVVMVMW